jgi:branched-chain amino acid transport system permease protein
VIERLRGAAPGAWGGVALAAVTLLVPVALDDSQLSVYVLIGLSAMVAVGLSLLMGFAGQVSLGQAAFYAIGAYTAGILARHGVSPLLGLVAAPALTAAVAFAVGLPLLRLRGHYLAFGTLAVQLIVLAVIADARPLTGGDTGLTAIPDLSVGPLALSGHFRVFGYAYVVWIACAALVLATRNLVRSRPGRGLRALASSEQGALAAGVPVAMYKIEVFALSAAYAGLAGAIYAFFLGYIAPESFPVTLSFQLLLMAVVGGLTTIWGAVVGAAVITLLDQALLSLGTVPGMPAHAPVVLTNAVFAAILILVVLFVPEGLVPGLGRLRGRLRGQAPEP